MEFIVVSTLSMLLEPRQTRGGDKGDRMIFPTRVSIYMRDFWGEGKGRGKGCVQPVVNVFEGVGTSAHHVERVGVDVRRL